MILQCICLFFFAQTGATTQNVFIIGKSGVGKSTYLNLLNDEFDSDDELIQISSAGFANGGLTNLSILAGPVLSIGDTQFFDTPGVPDFNPEGVRTANFSDGIVAAMKEHGVNDIIIAFKYPERSSSLDQDPLVVNFHLIFSECFSAVDKSHVKVLFTQAPYPETKKEKQEFATHEARLRKVVENIYGPVDVLFSWTDATKRRNDEYRTGMKQDFALSVSGGRIPPKLLRSYSELKTDLLAAYRGELSTALVAARQAQNLKSNIDSVVADIEWHRNRIHDLSITVATTGWIPGIGVATTLGCSVAIADSERKIPSLESSKADLERQLTSFDKTEEAARNEVARLKKKGDELAAVFSASTFL